MKEIVPAPPPLVRNDTASVQALFAENVVPSYGRFDLVLSHGSGSYVWDVAGKRYLDMGGGIAVCALGHAPAAITEAMIEQSRRLVHVSNLYYNEPQGRLAQRLVSFIAPGKVFFCNSGAEANEGLYKLARKFGHDEGRFEVLTAFNSFHGRTLAGIAATGQDKVRKGFEPLVPGFRQVPYNDLEAVEKAISPATAAILIEGIQGEGGVTPATADYLLGLRKLCNDRKMLLLMDAVQDGHFRTGRFQAFQRILEGIPGGADFLPDGISMAKSLGGGFPMGAFWIQQQYGDLLSAGTHGTTFGGTPLACTVALKVLEVIEQEKLADNARNLGEFLKKGFFKLRAKYPTLIKDVRGLGLMIGVELQPEIKNLPGDPAKMQAIRMVVQLQHAGMLTVPSGAQVIRFLPPLNLQPTQAQEALDVFDKVLGSLASAH